MVHRPIFEAQKILWVSDAMHWRPNASVGDQFCDKRFLFVPLATSSHHVIARCYQ